MGELFLYHFPRRQGDNSLYGNLTPAKKTGKIISSCCIIGSKKGVFANSPNYQIPNTVSLSASDFGELRQMIEHRSPYGIAFKKDAKSLSGITQVQYLSGKQIRDRTFRIEELPFIDLVRTQGHEVMIGPHLSDRIPKYDFSWEQEYRLVTDEWHFQKEDIAFVAVQNKNEVEQIRKITGIDSVVILDELAKMKTAIAPYLRNPNANVSIEPLICKMLDAHNELIGKPLDEILNEMCKKLNKGSEQSQTNEKQMKQTA